MGLVTEQTATRDYVPPSLEEIRAKAADHLVTVRGSHLIIVNYTPRTQFGRLWDDVTRACRGLILRVDPPWPHSERIEEVVALPFGKFFNVGELAEWPTSPVAEVTNKEDGSLGILYRGANGYAVATRGSFTSEQAQWATTFIRGCDLSGLDNALTLLFEIVYPDNHIVVDYGERRDLILLGVRNRFTGEDWFYPRVAALGIALGLSVVPRGAVRDIETAMRARFALGANEEGWVIRCQDGQRWKVKGEIYRQLHRLLSHLSERAVLDAIADGTIDDLIATTPDEWAGTVETWRAGIEANLSRQKDELAAIFGQAPRDTRKDFALWTMANHKPVASCLFALLDGKDPTPILLKAMREGLGTQTLVNPDEG